MAVNDMQWKWCQASKNNKKNNDTYMSYHIKDVRWLQKTKYKK